MNKILREFEPAVPRPPYGLVLLDAFRTEWETADEVTPHILDLPPYLIGGEIEGVTKVRRTLRSAQWPTTDRIAFRGLAYTTLAGVPFAIIDVGAPTSASGTPEHDVTERAGWRGLWRKRTRTVPASIGWVTIQLQPYLLELPDPDRPARFAPEPAVGKPLTRTEAHP